MRLAEIGVKLTSFESKLDSTYQGTLRIACFKCRLAPYFKKGFVWQQSIYGQRTHRKNIILRQIYKYKQLNTTILF